jgi:hypothetical protein
MEPILKCSKRWMVQKLQLVWVRFSSYNNTLGLALTARINSGNAAAVRGPVNSESETDNTVDNMGTVAAGHYCMVGGIPH